MNTTPLYALPENVVTRWASAENYDAAPGAGGLANFGRKGSPCRPLAAGESFTMAQAEGSGAIRRIWVTISERTPQMLRGLVVRVYWDGAEKPAVEAPLGDFFCQPLGRTATFENAWFDNPEGRSFNCRIPMPFRKDFRMTVTNESSDDLKHLFYDVNFTLGDEHGPEVGYFHAHYHRQNPTTLRRDFEILPRVEGRGRFLGCSIGVIANTLDNGPFWWGEGEVKVYIDGDAEHPTLCGTGTEDYIGTAWGQGCYACMWHGCPVADRDKMQFSFYRLHGPDPVYFQRNIKVAVQQLGCYKRSEMPEFMRSKGIAELPAAGDGSGTLAIADVEAGPEFNLFERQDDWCATAYFYMDRPCSGLPSIGNCESRVADLS